MNRTLTINTFAARVALLTGMDNEACVAFVKNAFNVISEGLKESSSVKIKGFGEFVLYDKGVQFIADEAVAQRVNDPFSFFEPVEVDAGTTDESLSAEINDTTAILLPETETEPRENSEDNIRREDEIENNEESGELIKESLNNDETIDEDEVNNEVDSKVDDKDSIDENIISHEQKSEVLIVQINDKQHESSNDAEINEDVIDVEDANQIIEKVVDNKQISSDVQQTVKPEEEPSLTSESSKDSISSEVDYAPDEKSREVKQEISIRGYGLEISPELNVEQRSSDRRMRVIMFLLGLILGIIVATALMYFLPGFIA